MEPIPNPLTLTVEQAAKILGIGRSTAYELVHTGAIPSLRLGRRIVVPTARLAEQLGVAVADLNSPPKTEPSTALTAGIAVGSRARTPPRRSTDPSTLF